MRVHEIITEAPAGMIGQGLKKFGAAALGALGAKSAAASLSKSADVGDRANAYSKEFNAYMARKGLRTADADYSDVNDFIVKMGLPKPNIPTQGPIQIGNLDNVFTAIAKMPAGTSTQQKTTNKPATAAPATQATQPAAGQPAAASQPNLDTPAYLRRGKKIAGVNAPSQPAAPKAKKPASVAGQSADPYDSYKGQMRKLQSTGAKPLPDKMVASLNADMAKLAKGDKNSGIYAADKILKFAKAGYDVSKLQQQWQGMARAGERFLTQSVYRAITAMLAEHGLRWADLGIRVRIVESISSVVFISRK